MKIGSYWHSYHKHCGFLCPADSECQLKFPSDISFMKMVKPCPEEKRLKIKESNAETRQRRSRQTCRVFKVKVDHSKLSKKQKEQLKMMFVEGKWLRNDRLAWSRDNHKSVFDCEVPHKNEKVKVKTKDGGFEKRELKHLGSQMAQDVVSEMDREIEAYLQEM